MLKHHILSRAAVRGNGRVVHSHVRLTLAALAPRSAVMLPAWHLALRDQELPGRGLLRRPPGFHRLTAGEIRHGIGSAVWFPARRGERPLRSVGPRQGPARRIGRSSPERQPTLRLPPQSLRSAETHSGLGPIAMAVYCDVWVLTSRDRMSLPSGAALISLATPST